MEAKHPTKQRNLPPLEAGQPYLAADFDRFEYFGAALSGSTSILRLHLKNGTTIDLPASDGELRRLMRILCAAFLTDTAKLCRELGWA